MGKGEWGPFEYWKLHARAMMTPNMARASPEEVKVAVWEGFEFGDRMLWEEHGEGRY